MHGCVFLRACGDRSEVCGGKRMVFKDKNKTVGGENCSERKVVGQLDSEHC